MPKDKLTITQVTKLVPQSEQTLRRLIKEGKVEAEKLGRDWYITVDEVENIKELANEQG